jgi:hypothetical protein
MQSCGCGLAYVVDWLFTFLVAVGFFTVLIKNEEGSAKPKFFFFLSRA